MAYNYLGLTIGPVIEVLQNSRKTRELWMGSYMFSFLMKTMIMDLKEKGYEFLAPFFCEETIEKVSSVGLFYDRFIAGSEKCKDDIEKDLSDAINAAIERLTQIIVSIKSKQPEKENEKEKRVKDYLKQYLQFSYIITPLKDSDNIFFEISNFLDSAELQRTFVAEPAQYNTFGITKKNEIDGSQKTYLTDPVTYFQFNANKTELKKKAFKSADKRFLSMPEIAGMELEIEFDDDDNTKDPFSDCPDVKLKHKYAAIIQADGDNIGDIIKKVGSRPEKAKRFSEALFAFAAAVPDISEKFGAQVIYAGGDDVLAFAPIVYREYTVFDYLDELNRHFRHEMRKLNLEEAQNVSLSFGVAAVYHKYPLYEALERARKNLFVTAKKFKLCGKSHKNAICFELIKHSGYSMQNVFLQNKDIIYKPFKDFLKKELSGDSAVPHAIQHNLKRSEKVIIELSQKDDFQQRLEYFFENTFDESSHKTDKAEKGLKLTQLLLKVFFEFYKEDKKKCDDIFAEFFSALSIIKHLRGDR